jgi:hypothetical protein
MARPVLAFKPMAQVLMVAFAISLKDIVRGFAAAQCGEATPYRLIIPLIVEAAPRNSKEA